MTNLSKRWIYCLMIVLGFSFSAQADPAQKKRVKDKIEELADIIYSEVRTSQASIENLQEAKRLVKEALRLIRNRQKDSDPFFGGLFMLDGTSASRCLVANPQTSVCGCPAGFNRTLSGQTNSNGYDIYICQKGLNRGEVNRGPFGGAFRLDGSSALRCLEVNPQTGDCSCPEGFNRAMSGQTNSDGNDIFVCQRDARGSHAGFFGGLYLLDGSSAHRCLDANPQTDGCRCPQGFRADLSGQTNSDGNDIYICQAQ